MVGLLTLNKKVNKLCEPRLLIAMDFDETYRPVTQGMTAINAGLRALEKYILSLRRSRLVTFGIITGRNFESTLALLDGYANILPDFIASSLGSELRWFSVNSYYEDALWRAKAGTAEQFAARRVKFEELLGDQVPALPPQPKESIGKRIAGYYLPDDSRAYDRARILTYCAHQVGLKAALTPCAPAAGDPVGFFDVAVTPPCCSKVAILEFVAQRIGTHLGNTWAFGDGANDLEMLVAARHGFLVGNAEASVKCKHSRHTIAPYCYGIVEALSAGLCEDRSVPVIMDWS